MNPYAPPSSPPREPEVLQPPEVRILRSPGKQAFQHRATKFFSWLTWIFLACYLGYIALTWQRPSAATHPPSEFNIVLFFLITLPNAVLRALEGDQRRLLSQARSLLDGIPLAAGSVRFAHPRSASFIIRGSLFLSDRELRFHPRGRRPSITTIPLRDITRVLPGPSRGFVSLALATGTLEGFHSDCPDLWLAEIQAAIDRHPSKNQ